LYFPTVVDLRHAGVATDDQRCSDLGKSILQDLGGNAIDAAIAVTLCLGIVNPAGSTPGGGAVSTRYNCGNEDSIFDLSFFTNSLLEQFVLLHTDKVKGRKHTHFVDEREQKEPESVNKVTEVIDCREIAPMYASMEMFDGKRDDASWTGPLAMGVPGQLHCLELMHSRHGRVPWRELILPAAKMAREGVVVTSYLGHAINLRSSKKKILEHPELHKLLTKNHDGENLLEEGDILTNPALADTLEAIAEDGIKAIYEGERAKQMAQEIQDLGGILTAEDMNNYRATMRDPLITKPGEVKG
jgi:gamma-glutamyltranspeptidase